jgi:uncharacterized membrane protein YadS
MVEQQRKGISEDWLSLGLGIFIFLLSLGLFGGVDALGWGVKTSEWLAPGKALSPVSKGYSIPGPGALALTYLFLLAVMSAGAALLRADVKRFAIGFTGIFWLGFACWMSGHYAHIAVTPDKLQKFGITWSLNLTGEAGFIIALLAGLAVGNFFPGLGDRLREAVRPELYIKTAIVIMGGTLGVKAAESLGLASAVMFRGLCAIVEAYLIYWALVYFIARKYFKFSREWAAPLASGISICGVSAAIATGGAIRARPVVPIMVSSLVVIFAVVELLLLPYVAKTFLWNEPLVAGAWMGLAVKTDGAAVASGAITDAWVRAQALAQSGVNYRDGWILMTATTVKMFIDVFIGIWAFVLAIVWCTKIEPKPGEKVRFREIWSRFPKFVIGYVVTFFAFLALTYPASKQINAAEGEKKVLAEQIRAAEKDLKSAADARASADLSERIHASQRSLAAVDAALKTPKATLVTAKTATDESNAFRVLFFVMTFFSIGVVSNFKKLWEEGIGRLAAVYAVSLFGFIIWIGLFISWVFFHGVKPPLAG